MTYITMTDHTTQTTTTSVGDRVWVPVQTSTLPNPTYHTKTFVFTQRAFQEMDTGIDRITATALPLDPVTILVRDDHDLKTTKTVCLERHAKKSPPVHRYPTLATNNVLIRTTTVDTRTIPIAQAVHHPIKAVPTPHNSGPLWGEQAESIKPAKPHSNTTVDSPNVGRCHLKDIKDKIEPISFYIAYIPYKTKATYRAMLRAAW